MGDDQHISSLRPILLSARKAASHAAKTGSIPVWAITSGVTMTQVHTKLVTQYELSKLVSSILNRYTTIQQLEYEEVSEGFMYTPRYFWLMDGKVKKLKAAVPEQMTDEILAETVHLIVTEIITIIMDKEVRKFIGK